MSSGSEPRATFSRPGGESSGWTSAISALEPLILYRGYPAEELVTGATFLEAAYLLLTGDFPSDEQLADWQALLTEGLSLPTSWQNWLRKVPTSASPLAVVQAGLARRPLGEDHLGAWSHQDVIDVFPGWLGFITALAIQHHRLSHGEPLGEPREDLGFAANVWWMLHGQEPATWKEQALDAGLVALAEHGLTLSTMAVRMTAASSADFMAALLAGVAVVQGQRQVGEAEEALQVLMSVRQSQRADAWVRDRLSKGSVPGFQHRIYRVGDPRAEWLSLRCRKVAEILGRLDREDFVSTIEQAVWEQQQRLPSVVWPATRLLDYLGVEPQLFGPMFLMSRLAGWSAHYVEQRHASNPPIFPHTYLGPTLRRRPTR